MVNFDARNQISGTAEAIVAKFYMRVEYIKYYPLGMTECPIMGVVRSPDLFFIFTPIISLELMKLGTSNFVR